VGKQSTLGEGKSNTSPHSGSYDYVGCLQNGLGGFIRESTNRGEVVSDGSQGSHKHTRAESSVFCLEVFVKDQANKVICFKIDNTTAVAYLNNLGGTHCPQLLQLTLEIWDWCEKKCLFLLAQRVPGKDNTAADTESRTVRDLNDWKLSSTVIHPMITECQVDLFASRLSHQLDQYVSWRPDHKAIHTDAFTMNWSNMTAYAFPPFNMIHAVLEKRE
jgi:hypothetical protein